jgi:hypothetical protein
MREQQPLLAVHLVEPGPVHPEEPSKRIDELDGERLVGHDSVRLAEEGEDRLPVASAQTRHGLNKDTPNGA